MGKVEVEVEETSESDGAMAPLEVVLGFVNEEEEEENRSKVI